MTHILSCEVPEKQDNGNDREEASFSATLTRLSGRTQDTASHSDDATSPAAVST